ncbi:MAG: InlB B-repeat-containing protein, partial [Clostridia bacterium]|nr:InlB B-repeat-containing protein [Clostridia bacterium]
MDKTKKVAKVMLICFLVFVIVLFCTFLGVLIGYKVSCDKMMKDRVIQCDNVTYRRLSVVDSTSDFIKKHCGKYYYKATKINALDEDGNDITVKFIAAEINGIPVMAMGSSGIGYHSHSSGVLKRLYAPGSIDYVDFDYLTAYNGNCLSVFYCGSVTDFYHCMGNHSSEKILLKAYVPNRLYAEFAEASHGAGKDLEIYKANISYRMNAAEKSEYYYVDYVNYGEKIANVPPAPTREGYKFGGWYT